MPATTPLGEEIWNQTQGEVDAFVHCVGTAASSRGVATALKRHKPRLRNVAVEPAESSVLLGGTAGPHKIEGVGVGFIPPLWEPSLVDEIVPVRTEDAKVMARRLAREEALFAGTSSGANVVAAIHVARRLGRGGQGRHADGRFRPEIPEHRRLPQPLSPCPPIHDIPVVYPLLKEPPPRDGFFFSPSLPSSLTIPLGLDILKIVVNWAKTNTICEIRLFQQRQVG